MERLDVGEAEHGEDLGGEERRDEEHIHEEVVNGERPAVDQVYVEENREGALNSVEDQLLEAVSVESDAEDHVEHR